MVTAKGQIIGETKSNSRDLKDVEKGRMEERTF